MLFALFLALGLIAGLNANPASGCSGCNIQGTCVAVGQTHTEGCAVYNCYAAGSYNIASFGCKVGGECKSNGDTWEVSQCVTKSCTVTQNPWNAVIGFASLGCATSQGCKADGESWTEDCMEKTCEASTASIGPKITGAKCKDVNGACHEPGEFFAYMQHSNCNCSVDATTFERSYMCYN